MFNMDHSHELKEVYDKWGKEYDEDAAHNIAIIKVHPVVLDLIKDEPQKDVGLDLGCGTGILLAEISQFSKEITGVDYSDGMLNEARKKQSMGAKIRFVKADLNKKLPFDNDSFDYVIAVLTLHHLENLEEIYQEIFRVLKTNGFLIFDEFVTRPLTQEQIDHPFHVNYPDPLTDAKKSGIKVWRIRPFAEHKELLKKAGFKIEKVIDAFCDDEIKPYIINYKYHKGRVLAKIVLARKI